MDPMSRITKFLDERAKVRGLDQEQIASLHVGDEREAVLLTSDLRRLLDIIEHKYGTDECDGRSDRDQEIERLRSDLALAQGQRDASERALRALVADCLASDFNEHWDSFVVAQDTLEAMPHIEIDASEREVERLRELAAVQAREAKLREACSSASMWLQPTYTTTAHAKMLCHEALSQPADDTLLREMIEAARAEGMEEAAKMCDWLNGEKRLTPAGCAAAIRAKIIK